MQMLAEQRSRMEALPNSRDVSIIRVNCHKLKVGDVVRDGHVHDTNPLSYELV
jgi:hypothetical protein